jgi:hypothetical protein
MFRNKLHCDMMVVVIARSKELGKVCECPHFWLFSLPSWLLYCVDIKRVNISSSQFVLIWNYASSFFF